MTVPLLILAVLPVIAGYFNMHAPDPLILFASVIAVVFGGLMASGLSKCYRGSVAGQPGFVATEGRFGSMKLTNC